MKSTKRTNIGSWVRGNDIERCFDVMYAAGILSNDKVNAIRRHIPAIIVQGESPSKSTKLLRLSSIKINPTTINNVVDEMVLTFSDAEKSVEIVSTFSWPRGRYVQHITGIEDGDRFIGAEKCGPSGISSGIRIYFMRALCAEYMALACILGVSPRTIIRIKRE